MPRNAASASGGRKLKGEEKNKAKWMNEAKRNKKRAEEAEEKLAQLQAKLSLSESNGDPTTDHANGVVVTTPTVVDIKNVDDAPVSVSREEFDMLKSQLEAVKMAHSAALREKQLAESSSNNERGVLQASLDFAQQESKKLMDELAVAKKAEQVARMLFEQTNKANLEKEKTILELSSSTTATTTSSTSADNVTNTPSVGVTTPAFNVILDSPAPGKNVSPITPERLDFSDNSPLGSPNTIINNSTNPAATTTTTMQRGGIDLLCATSSNAMTIPKPTSTSLFAKIHKWILNLFASIRALFTGRNNNTTAPENTPLLRIAV